MSPFARKQPPPACLAIADSLVEIINFDYLNISSNETTRSSYSDYKFLSLALSPLFRWLLNIVWVRERRAEDSSRLALAEDNSRVKVGLSWRRFIQILVNICELGFFQNLLVWLGVLNSVHVSQFRGLDCCRNKGSQYTAIQMPYTNSRNIKPSQTYRE
jgi:hypothetical protein